LFITPIGMGAWAIGGQGWAFSWGPQDDRESVAAIHECVDAGMNWIDTAPVYGFGKSEQIVGDALVGMADRPLVFTKCGRIRNDDGSIGKRLTADSIRDECEASLRRLRVDAIDLYQLHWPEPEEQIEEGWETLNRLKREGKVREIGVSNFSVRQLERIAPIGPIASLQPPYSLCRRDVEADLLPYCQDHDVGVISYSPMRCGLLSGSMTRERIAALPEDDWRKTKNLDFQEPLLSKYLGLVEELRSIGRGRRPALKSIAVAANGSSSDDVVPGAVAIGYVLANRAVTGAIVGVRKPGQIGPLLSAVDFVLTEQDLVRIEAKLADG
jgi:aryl-alcohol dehydrogenase-like predicted oxidoreductase